MHSVIYTYLFQRKIMSICMCNSLIAVGLFKAMYNDQQLYMWDRKSAVI